MRRRKTTLMMIERGNSRRVSRPPALYNFETRGVK